MKISDNAFIVGRGLFFDCIDCRALVHVTLPEGSDWHLRKCPECPRTYWIRDHQDFAQVCPTSPLKDGQEMPDGMTYPYVPEDFAS